MKETSGEVEGRSPNFDDRVNSLATLEKLETAMRLVEEAVKERPSLKELQIEPLMRSLATEVARFSGVVRMRLVTSAGFEQGRDRADQQPLKRSKKGRWSRRFPRLGWQQLACDQVGLYLSKWF